MKQKVGTGRQKEICPWCQQKIYVFPGRHQPCPQCVKPINVYSGGEGVEEIILRQLRYAFQTAQNELVEFEGALSENLQVNSEALHFARARLKRLQEKLKDARRK